MDRCSPLPVPYSHFHESRTFRILRSSLVSSAIPTIPPPPPPQRNPFFARSLISTVSNRFFLLYFIVSEHRLYGLSLFFFNPLFFLFDGFFLLLLFLGNFIYLFFFVIFNVPFFSVFSFYTCSTLYFSRVFS